MNEEISFHKVQSVNNDLIDLIAKWYFDEWEIPIAYTHRRLENIPNKDVIFQLILSRDGEPIATGGLYNKVGLLNVHPKFRKFKPWVALLYTSKKNRNQGFGTILLKKVEELSKEMGIDVIYLHTFSAESLYLRNNWKPIGRVAYKGHITSVMKKEI